MFDAAFLVGLDVEFTKLAEFPEFVDPGMRARIVSVNWVESDELYKLALDFSVWDTYNEPLFSRSFYNGRTFAYDKTAKEIGFYEPIADFYCDEEYFNQHCVILNDNSVKMYKQYADSKTDLSYVRWLEERP